MGAQGSVANAKEDTVALFAGAYFGEDYSHFAVPLTEDATGGYLDPDPLRSISGETGRELVVRVAYSPPSTNRVILAHADPANAANNTYLIYLNGSSQIVFQQGVTALFTSSVNAAADLYLAWFTRPNPLTTGASDALMSEFAVYNITTAAWVEIEQVAHAVPTVNTGWALHAGGFWDGATFGSLSGQIEDLRIGVALDHSTAELAEDFVASRTAPVADDSPISVVLPLAGDAGMADEGEWTGSANIGWIAAHGSSKRRAQWSPLVGEVYLDAEAVSQPPEPTQWFRAAPGTDGTKHMLRLDSLRWMPVPAGCSHVAVRVHVKSTGAADPCVVRVYAFNRPTERPTKIEQPQAPPFDFTFLEADPLAIDHGAGPGEWLTWSGDETGLLRLPLWTPDVPGYRQTVHLCLSVWVADPASDLAIRAWHARPTVRYIGQGIE